MQFMEKIAIMARITHRITPLIGANPPIHPISGIVVN
jgi:hypothetical protein